MYCSKCGAQNADSSSFCIKCGNSLQQPVQPTQPAQPAVNTNGAAAPTASKKKKKKKKTGVIVAIILIVIALAGAGTAAYFILDPFSSAGSASYEEAAKRSIEAMYVDFDAVAQLELYPEKLVDYTMEENQFTSRESILDVLNAELQSTQEDFEDEYGEDFEVTYEIEYAEDIDIDGDAFSGSKKLFEEIGFELTAAKTVYATMNIEGELYENNMTAEVVVISDGKSWYLVGISIYVDYLNS